MIEIESGYATSPWTFVLVLAAAVFAVVLFLLFPNPNKEYSDDYLLVRFMHSGMLYEVGFVNTYASCAYHLFEGADPRSKDLFGVPGSIDLDGQILVINDISKIEMLEVHIDGDRTCDKPKGKVVRKF